MTTTDGIYIDERLVKRVDASGPKSAQMVLQNPRVDIAVFEVARGGILREGLGYGRNDVGVVLNVTGDHLGLREIDTLEQLAAVKQVVVEAVPRNGCGGAERRRSARARDAPALQRQRDPVHDARERTTWSNGGSGEAARPSCSSAATRGEMMVIKEGRRTMPIAWVHTLPVDLRRQGAHDGAERDGRRGRGARRRRAPPRHPSGPALVHDLDLPGAGPAERLRPRRRQGGDRLRAQRGRARDARATSSSGSRPTRRRASAPARPRWSANLRVAVVATAGDRRDEDMQELGRVAARYFDEVIVREDRNARGRERGETAELIRAGRRGSHRARAARAPAASRSCSTRWRRRAGRSTVRVRATWSCCASTTPPRSTRSSSSGAASPRPTSCARSRGRPRPTRSGGDPDLVG